MNNETNPGTVDGRFTQERIAAATAETERLCSELNITNADHIALWLEANMADSSLAWLACRIVEAHEAANAVSAISANWDQQPSPQPDMGSGKARTRVAEAVGRVLGIDIHERCPSEDSEGDLGCDSSTCPGALTEDHDTEEHRERIYRMADAAISALSPPASQSVEKLREALKNLTRFADDHGLEQERGGVAIMKAAWDALSTLPHKGEATPPPVGEQGAGLTDTERLDRLAAESWDLRCHDIPTGGGDADIGWCVIGHWMAEPRERIMGEAWTDDPRAAIDDAIRRATPATTERGRG